MKLTATLSHNHGHRRAGAGDGARATPSGRTVEPRHTKAFHFIHVLHVLHVNDNNSATGQQQQWQQQQAEKQQKSFACRHNLLENVAKLICNWWIRNHSEKEKQNEKQLWWWRGRKKKKRESSRCYGIIKHLGLAGGKGWLGMAYLLAAVEIHQENRAAFTF